MREIIFDTETTGFDPFSGDRIVEIGAVEMINRVLTGENFHVYCNPERDMPEGAFKVHGISTEFLADKPLIIDVLDDFLAFVGDAPLVAHNATFDMKFINWELENASKTPIPKGQFTDTLIIARTKYPGQPNSLDALCKRLGVNNSNRALHGALLDSEILADVYVELLGGRQAGLDLSVVSKGMADTGGYKIKREVRVFAASAEEKAAHATFIDKLDEPIWKR